ncbi:hypothetical protein [Pseudomonas fluorescens]|uniref:hypothetical protein n=1 Tax=Pseudomonas fluorescens TaxID=294 RepID=UPI00192BFADF|nr:hypothetical protein [Pseudomonas fluorescens]MBL4980151.1 hypothetical protein [Pseudomonas fluorescens]
MARKLIEEFITLPDGSVIKNHPRHDFDKPTKLMLQHMVAGVCSNPDCLNHTIGSNIQRNSYAGNGIAAHICAAAPGAGAARYDKNQTKEERQSFKNGLWLCGSCSIIIDRDEARYPVALLHEWKSKAENRAMTMIGQKSITPFELQNSVREAIIQTVQSLAIGTNPHKPKVVESLASYEAFLNSLDGRFDVKVTATSNSMFSEIKARPGHNPLVLMVFNDGALDSAQTAWRTMLENGQSFSIPTSGFEFKGSKLFESLNEELADGVMTISPNTKIVEASIYFLSDNGEFELATVNASMSRGTKRLAIDGKALDGIFSFDYEYLVDSGVTNFNYTFNVDFWLNQKITQLKHYNKLMKAHKFISGSKNLTICVKAHVGNSEVSLGVGPSSSYDAIFERILSIMHLAECGTKIASHFSQSLQFKTLELSAIEDEMILRYAKALDGDVLDTFEEGSEICTVVLKDVPPEMMTAMENHNVNTQLRFTENTTFDFFGNRVTLPKIVTDMNHIELNLFSSIHRKSKGALCCVVYAVSDTQSVQYLAADESYILHEV